ncbi:MAG: glutamate-1-semialdehyde 2,1-aminomutase [Tissierellia bacterium]|nr:glutamate-1-semialdehyde 2,1-aminomutase [Tissierellia bacterium]
MNLFERGKAVIPGGVNSPVRAFGSVHTDPIFIDHAKGPYLYSNEGQQYIDMVNSWGPMILGHGREDLLSLVPRYLEEGMSFGLPTEVEVEMAEFLTEAIGTDMIRMVNSGTEATMSAIRLARGYTQRKKIIKFEGCYHGHSDGLLVSSGSGTLTFKQPTSLGVPEEIISQTLVARYNDLEDVRRLFAEHPQDIAAVILEPIAGNMGVVPASVEFIQGLRALTQEEGALLIFDEVITGFRCHFGSVKEDFGVEPDLFCFGKIIGGGLPVGAFAGKREIMSLLSPLGGVYQAGTLSGNPLAMKMGLDVLHILKEQPEIYRELNRKADVLVEGFEDNIRATGIPAKVTRFKTMVCLFFGEFDEIKSYDDVRQADTELFEAYYREMLGAHILLPPSQFEALFLSHAHSDAILEYVIEQNKKALEKIRA